MPWVYSKIHVHISQLSDCAVMKLQPENNLLQASLPAHQRAGLGFRAPCHSTCICYAYLTLDHPSPFPFLWPLSDSQLILLALSAERIRRPQTQKQAVAQNRQQAPKKQAQPKERKDKLDVLVEKYRRSLLGSTQQKAGATKGSEQKDLKRWFE